MPVTFEPLPGDSAHGPDRPEFGLAGSPEMDRLHRHCSIMHQPPVEACSGCVLAEVDDAHISDAATEVEVRCDPRRLRHSPSVSRGHGSFLNTGPAGMPSRRWLGRITRRAPPTPDIA